MPGMGGMPGIGMMPGMSDEQRLEELKRNDPEMYELSKKDEDLNREAMQLGDQIRRAPRDSREALKKQLQETVQKHFDARQARRELQLKRLAEEIEKMKSTITKRQEMKEQIIGRRVAELAGEQTDFDF